MAAETLLVDGILTQPNLTVTLTDIDDDPASPDGNWAIWDGNGNSQLRCSLPTPTGNPTGGADLQTFRVRIRRDGGTGTNSVDWALHVYQNASSFLDNIATGTTTSTGETITATWDATGIAVADGSDIEIYIEQTAGGTGGPSSRRGLEIDGFAWDVEYGSALTPEIPILTATRRAP